ncbi:MAG: hypothetical protein KDB23_20035 [Planctomycetales bacterium]|nr:hypothetical protein [Planctomycetales bacterium]
MSRSWKRLRRHFLGWTVGAAIFGFGIGASFDAFGQACDAPGVLSCDCEGCQAFLQGAAIDCDTPMSPSYPTPAYPIESPVQPISPDGMPTPADDSSEGVMPPTAPGDQPTIPSIQDMTSAPDSPFATPNMNAATPPIGGLASSLGTTSGFGGVPDMIGDFFGSGFRYGWIGGPDGTSIGAAGGDRRVKFAENNSPFPRNRVFFNYHNFNNAVTDPNGSDLDVNRYTFGVERAFYDNLLSAELRVPFAGTLSATPESGGSTSGTEFGNITLAFKGLLHQDECRAVSAGLAVVLPTGRDYIVGGDVVDNIFRNESVHLQPFLGLYYAPRPKVFTQFFSQLDFDTQGNGVTVAGISDTLREQTLMFMDLSVGYWLHKNPRARYFRSIAPMLELHYSTSLESQGYGAFEGVSINSGSTIFIQDRRKDVLNLTGGLFFDLTQMTTVKVGAIVPLRTGFDKQFDAEFGVQVSRRY